MKASDDLYVLIKSLTKNEKRNFKIVSSYHNIGERNKYLDLFDAIDKQKIYDEQLIKKTFANEQFVKQLSVAKNYLYALILQSVGQYQDNVNARLRNYLDQAEFLMDKLLYKQCEKLLSKAKHLALKYEKHAILLDIFALENNLLSKQSYTTKTEDQIRDASKEAFSAIDKFRNIIQYNQLSNSIYKQASKEGKTKTALDVAFYKNIIKSDLFSSEDHALSFTAKKSFYLGQIAYYNWQSNFRKVKLYAQKLIALFETNPQFIADNPSGYYNSYMHFVANIINLHRYNEVHPVIEKMKAINIKSNHLQNQNFIFLNSILMTTTINTGQFKKGAELVTSIQKEMQEKKIKFLNPGNEIMFDYCFACIYFGAENYSKANYFFNKIVNNNLNVRNDLYCFAKILSIIVHYEMGNDDLIESIAKSTYRYLFKKQRLFKFENIILKFIREELPNTHTLKARIAAFKVLKKEIIEISKDPREKTFLNYFDIVSWLESKIENRSFGEIVKEKAEGKFIR